VAAGGSHNLACARTEPRRVGDSSSGNWATAVTGQQSSGIGEPKAALLPAKPWSPSPQRPIIRSSCVRMEPWRGGVLTTMDDWATQGHQFEQRAVLVDQTGVLAADGDRDCCRGQQQLCPLRGPVQSRHGIQFQLPIGQALRAIAMWRCGSTKRAPLRQEGGSDWAGGSFGLGGMRDGPCLPGGQRQRTVGQQNTSNSSFQCWWIAPACCRQNDCGNCTGTNHSMAFVGTEPWPRGDPTATISWATAARRTQCAGVGQPNGCACGANHHSLAVNVSQPGVVRERIVDRWDTTTVAKWAMAATRIEVRRCS